MTDRGTKLERALESLQRTSEALERSRGTITEQDWKAAYVRAVERVEQNR
jgi:hypothetical protein